MLIRMHVMLALMMGAATASPPPPEGHEASPLDGRATASDFDADDSQPASDVALDDDVDDDDNITLLAKSRPLARGTRVSAQAKHFGPTGPAWAETTFGTQADGSAAGSVRVYGTVTQVFKGLGAVRFKVKWDIRVPEPPVTASGDSVESNPAAIGREWWTSSVARKEHMNAGAPLVLLNRPANRPVLEAGQEVENCTDRMPAEVDGATLTIDRTADTDDDDDDDDYLPGATEALQRSRGELTTGDEELPANIPTDEIFANISAGKTWTAPAEFRGNTVRCFLLFSCCSVGLPVGLSIRVL
jgi:hypothetical protein